MNKEFNKNYALAICYRIYPKVSKIPPIFADNKLKLAELCLVSFKEALGNLRAKLIVLLDSCPEEYEKLFTKYFEESDIELIRLFHAGNPGSFGKQIEVLLNQCYSEIIYFAEDDYFYLPNSFSKMLEIMNSRSDIHFLSPYNHPDYDNLKLHNYKSEKIEINNTLWKTVSTTTMTFMTKQNVLNDTLKTFLSYTQKNNDNSLWLALTKKRIFNPCLYIYYFLKDWTIFKALIKIWKYTFRQALIGNKYKLWIPVQSLATHMESAYLAKGENWNLWFEKYRKKHNI